MFESDSVYALDLERWVIITNPAELYSSSVFVIGLMYFCSHGMRAIRSLVDVIRLPSLETRVRAFLFARSSADY